MYIENEKGKATAICTYTLQERSYAKEYNHVHLYMVSLFHSFGSRNQLSPINLRCCLQQLPFPSPFRAAWGDLTYREHMWMGSTQLQINKYNLLYKKLPQSGRSVGSQTTYHRRHISLDEGQNSSMTDCGNLGHKSNCYDSPNTKYIYTCYFAGQSIWLMSLLDTE